MGLIEETSPSEPSLLTAVGLACVWRLLESRTAASLANLPTEHMIRLLAAANLGHRLVRAMHSLHKTAQLQVLCASPQASAPALLQGSWSQPGCCECCCYEVGCVMPPLAVLDAPWEPSQGLCAPSSVNVHRVLDLVACSTAAGMQQAEDCCSAGSCTCDRPAAWNPRSQGDCAGEQSQVLDCEARLLLVHL